MALLLLVLHILVAAAAALNYCDTGDFQALQGLKSGFAQSVSLPDSWNNGTDCCLWSWITCNSNGRVDSLNVSSLALNADIQQDQSFVGNFIPRLTYLTSLDISNLNISASVPAAISTLPHLETLYLNNCSLSGQFPVELSNLTTLKTLDVSNNLFDSSDTEVTTAICSLRHLEHLSMSALPGLLTSIPPCIGQRLKNLTSLDISSNALTQDFPQSFTNLTNLVSLDLSDNYFTGSFHPVCSMLQLRSLDLELAFDATNSSTTTLPDCIGGLSRLTDLRLSGCYLVGTIPDTIGKLTNLRYLSLDGNSFTTRIPSSLGNLTKLEVLLLNKDATGGSDFYGELPSTLGNLHKLRDLELSSAPSITGQIPQSFKALSSLEVLTLSNLGLGGQLPDDLFTNMSRLAFLDFSQNLLMGELPRSIGTLTSLQEIYLYNNSFTGVIPEEISRLSQLTNLDLSSNQLSGGVPLGLDALRGLQVLDLSGNRLSGVIPEDLGELVNLATLDLSYNRLNGSIPSSLHDLVSLEYFSVASNQLSGQIPAELAGFDVSSFEDNAGLCGYPLDPCSSG